MIRNSIVENAYSGLLTHSMVYLLLSSFLISDFKNCAWSISIASLQEAPEQREVLVNTTVCALIFKGFNVRSFCRLPAIHESFVRENLDSNGYAQYNGQPNDDDTPRKMLLIIFTPSANPILLPRYFFATVCFVLAGCGVCIPSFLVPKRGSVSNLEKVVSLMMVKANKNIWAQKGIREYRARVSEADWCKGNEACTYQTITAHQKVTVVRHTSENGLSGIFHLLILKYHCVHAASANLKM